MATQLFDFGGRKVRSITIRTGRDCLGRMRLEHGAYEIEFNVLGLGDVKIEGCHDIGPDVFPDLPTLPVPR